MRVLALVTDAFGGYGGIAQYNRDILEAFAHLRGVGSVHVLPRYAPDPISEQPAAIIQYEAQEHRTVFALRAMQLAAKVKPDLVFCGHLHLGPLAALVARTVHARLLAQTHGLEVWEIPSEVRRRSLEASNAVLCVSRDTRAQVLTWADIAPERVRVVPNTVAAAFTPGDRASARIRLGLPSGKLILSVSRLDAGQKHKGQDRVIRCLPALVAAGLDVTYLIAGTGADEARLHALAVAEGVADRVRFLGRVAQDDLPDLYRASDLFALPSTGDGFGIVFIEAMACGVPALGLEAGGAVDALAEGRLGQAVAERDLVPALAAALRAPAPNPATLAARVRERFGREVFLNRIQATLAAVTE